jgi:integrase
MAPRAETSRAPAAPATSPRHLGRGGDAPVAAVDPIGPGDLVDSVDAFFAARLLPGAPPVGSDYRDALATAESFAAAALSPATRRAYRADARVFVAWCSSLPERPSPLPASAETVAGFVADQAARVGRKLSTIERRLAAIRCLHVLAEWPSPTDSLAVAKTMAGIRNTLGRGGARKKRGATDDVLAAMVAALPDDLRGTRDCALLLAGFAGALRRSELAGLDVADLEEVAAGIVVTLRRSKGDQAGEGQIVGLPRADGPLCPVRALKAWLAAAGIVEGPVFRSIFRRTGGKASERIGGARLDPRSVARIVQKCAGAAGLPAAEFGGHSLRRGPMTTASRGDASIWKMKELGRYRSLDTLLEYVEPRAVFEEHALHGVLGAAPADG